MSTYLEELEQQLAPKTNYVKFANNEKKILIFRGDEENAHVVDDERFGKRVRFTVTNVTDPIRPVENQYWDTSFRWARMIINYVKRNQECLEITRQGTGTDTQYIIMPAKTE